MKRICVAFGTRPEAVKMAPVVRALSHQEGLTPITLVSGQHREQLDSMLRIFNLIPDADLQVMTARQTLTELMGRIVPQAAKMLQTLRADYVLVHGDTLTTFAVALAAFFEGIPVAHVEAGLRSFDLSQPFPEEANRRLTDVLTDLDLPPTPLSKQHLLAEGKSPERMVVTGNTVVDAVMWASEHATWPQQLPLDRPLVTITMHRRENLPVMPQLAHALAKLARAHPAFTFVYPVHLNPAVRDAVYPAMRDVDNIVLAEPYDYLDMLGLMKGSSLIITDSGGLQEEGSALGVPVVVLRNVTERPEGVEAGTIKLAGNDPEGVIHTLEPLLADEHVRAQMKAAANPYGDGQASARIAQAVAWRFGLAQRPQDWHALTLK